MANWNMPADFTIQHDIPGYGDTVLIQTNYSKAEEWIPNVRFWAFTTEIAPSSRDIVIWRLKYHKPRRSS